MEGRNIKVKDLLNALKQYDPEAWVTLRLWHHSNVEDSWYTDDFIINIYHYTYEDEETWWEVTSKDIVLDLDVN